MAGDPITWTIIVDSVLRGNVAHESGGAIEFDGLGTMRIVRTRIIDNRAVDGGGILAWSGIGTSALVSREGTTNGALTQRASLLIGPATRLAGNLAARRGGGIWNDTALRIAGATVTGNTAGGRGGGLFNDLHGMATLGRDARVRGNVPGDCYGTTAC